MMPLLLLFQALACLLNPPAPFATDWMETEGKFLAAWQWNDLQQIEGRDLWMGYENGGWETTGDEYGVQKLSGADYEVWIFYSPTRNEYDLLPFANTALFADTNGEHYGMHPCGGWAVPVDALDMIIEGR